ncbi:MAG: hypothetical protein NC394_09525 [Bacteroides sp.]|nr:hypothetical protein [Bacteroides sp.]
MSLKSFDKFCEKMIMSEPVSQKMIFDERQKQVRSKLNIEVLIIFGAAVFANTVFMERLYQWCDTFSAPMLMIASVCHMYWMLRCYFSGAVFGINGVQSAKWSAVFFMVMIPVYFLLISDELFEEGGAFGNGMVSSYLVVGITYGILFVSTLTTYILAKRTEKREET